MGWKVKEVSRAALGTAAEARTMHELAGEISRILGPVLPHDGCMMTTLDPATGAPGLAARKNGYRPQVCYRMEIAHRAGRDFNHFAGLIAGPRPVTVFGAGSPNDPGTAHLHEIMAAEGVGSDLRLALTRHGRAWGGIILLRAHPATPFTTDDTLRAEHLSSPLATAMRRLVTGMPLEPARQVAPGTLVLDRNNQITAATPAGRHWLRELAIDPAHADDGHLVTAMVAPMVAARRGGPPVAATVPTCRGWVTVHAQPLDGDNTGDLAVTIQAPSSHELVPALAAWYGITPREQAIIQQAVEGLQLKQIARRQGLSPHTVNDYFKSIYRKTGIHSRDQLVACLTS